MNGKSSSALVCVLAVTWLFLPDELHALNGPDGSDAYATVAFPVLMSLTAGSITYGILNSQTEDHLEAGYWVPFGYSVAFGIVIATVVFNIIAELETGEEVAALAFFGLTILASVSGTIVGYKISQPQPNNGNVNMSLAKFVF